MEEFKTILYGIIRIFFEIMNVLFASIRTFNCHMFVIILGAGVFVASIFWLHRMARTQNQNYLEMIEYARSNNQISVYTDDFYTQRLIDAMCEEQNMEPYQSTLDELDLSDYKTCGISTIEALLYLLSDVDPQAEHELLSKMAIQHKYDIETYIRSRYLPAVQDEVDEGDYYAANRLIGRYFDLYPLFARPKELNAANNHEYLLRVFLQDRWELSCDRQLAARLIDFANVQQNQPKTHDWILEYAYDDVLINFVRYAQGVLMIQNKTYDMALSHFKKLVVDSHDSLLKQYAAFMAMRSAFWCYDVFKSADNKNQFIMLYKQYKPIVNIDYLLVDINYYYNMVLGS